MANVQPNQVNYESLYQPTLIDVTSTKWDKFGYTLIFCSTIIMSLQALHVGPQWIWTMSDDVTTVLFTFELGIRMFEKGYLFFEEEERNWNFFDTLVVAISLGSMILAGKGSGGSKDGKANCKHHKHHCHNEKKGAAASASMQKIKAMRTLRLLRLLRLLRFFKGIEKVNQLVDLFLNFLQLSFVGAIVLSALLALILTLVVATWAGAKAWLRVHTLPQLPKLE
mmetsp:Transcript_58317/g.104426  ORF Transcript_58317/g.104426 Transcript_58317/m.104426 type:complete len:224 (+) Transcript_58317:99-770(+)